MTVKPKLIQVNISSDDRGEISHSNNFNFSKLNIKRFYKMENHQENFIRAWHAHKKEEKYILILSGSIKISLVKIDDWKKPSKKLKIENYFLNEKSPQILFIPGGYAHGTQNLKKNTSFIVFSNFTIDESLKDDFRYPYDYWHNWNINFR